MFCGAREPFESKFISFLKGTLKFFFTDDPKYRNETYMRYIHTISQGIESKKKHLKSTLIQNYICNFYLNSFLCKINTYGMVMYLRNKNIVLLFNTY